MMMSMPPADVRPFVIDLGQEIRVGPSKYDAQPTVVPAAARDTRLPPGEGSVRYAIQRGSITDFDALESILLGALLNVSLVDTHVDTHASSKSIFLVFFFGND